MNDIINRIESLVELKKYDSALDLISQSLSTSPTPEFLYYLGSICYQELGDISRAISYIKTGISICPEDFDFQILLARLYLQNNEPLKCNRTLRSIRADGDIELEQHYEVASLSCIRQGKFESTLEYAEKALELNPNNVTVLSFLAFGNLVLGNNKSIDSYINRALEIEPEHAFAKYTYILLMLTKNQIDDSEELVLDALAQNPSDQIYRDGLKFVLLSKNIFSKSILWLRYFAARKQKSIRKIYSVIFRIILLGCLLLFMNNNFLKAYAVGVLIGNILLTLPFKTIPIIQNLFLSFSKYRKEVVSEHEWYSSVYAFCFLIVGIALCSYADFENSFLVSGLLAFYLSGFQFDYFYGIRKGLAKKHQLFFGLLNITFILIFFLKGNWVNLCYLSVILILVIYPILQKKSSIVT